VIKFKCLKEVIFCITGWLLFSFILDHLKRTVTFHHFSGRVTYALLERRHFCQHRKLMRVALLKSGGHLELVNASV
jgi:hypothetical protein